MPDFSPDEINLIFIYGNGRRKILIKQLTKMLDDAEDDEEFVQRCCSCRFISFIIDMSKRWLVV